MKAQTSDFLRLNEIMHLLTEAFENEDMTVGTMLDMVFKPDEHPIYRRRILSPFAITGLWWIDDEALWSRWSWNGYKDFVNSEMMKHAWTTRSVNPKGGAGLFVRECGGEYVDIEALVRVFKWNREKKKAEGVTSEWLTCSISLAEYERIGQFLGPAEIGCKHKELTDALPVEPRQTRLVVP